MKYSFSLIYYMFFSLKRKEYVSGRTVSQKSRLATGQARLAAGQARLASRTGSQNFYAR
jgi:hypothetical protein